MFDATKKTKLEKKTLAGACKKLEDGLAEKEALIEQSKKTYERKLAVAEKTGKMALRETRLAQTRREFEEQMRYLSHRIGELQVLPQFISPSQLADVTKRHAILLLVCLLTACTVPYQGAQRRVVAHGPHGVRHRNMCKAGQNR